MLTSRNVIAATISIAVVSLIGACVSVLLQSPGGSGIGENSYGTRGNGFRAIHDLLQELGVVVERSDLPNPDDYPADATLVLWRPLDAVVQTEPKYLDTIAAWIREGGRVVVAPARNADTSLLTALRPQHGSEHTRRSLLEALGLTGVTVGGLGDRPTAEVEEEEVDAAIHDPLPARRPPSDFADDDFDDFQKAIGDVFRPEELPTRIVKLRGEGGLAGHSSGVLHVRLPADDARAVLSNQTEPTGRILFTDPEGREHTLAAAFSVGRGEVVVVSEPSLLSNAYIADRDNSVLAVRLLVGNRARILFDEFYHGLTIRGNPLWLLTRRPYATITLALLAIVGLWNWRHGVFLGPSRSATQESRRSIGEYVEAMSRFLLKARGSSLFVLRQVRDGTLWMIRRKLGLPPGRDDAETVLATLSRRYPRAAHELSEALKEVDTAMQKSRPSELSVVQAVRKVTDCLSN